MKGKKIIALMSSTALLSTLTMVKPVKAEITNNRIYGKTRYQTSCEISKNNFSKSENVVVAYGGNFADALCAAPLAKSLNAPLLLTDTNDISDETLNEIKRLGANNAVIVGGTGVVSNLVQNKVSKICKNTKRISGKDRYETSLKVAEELKGVKKAVLTTGKNFADSLSISPIASKENMPIILCDGDLSNEAKKYISKLNLDNVYVLGGYKIISSNIEKEFNYAKRIFGKDRFETNLNILKNFSGNINFDKVYVTKASGKKDFADGLSISPVAASSSSPLILVGKSVFNNTETYVRNNSSMDTLIIGLGGEKVVSQNLLNNLSLNYKINDAINKSVQHIKNKKNKNYDDIIVLKMAKQNTTKDMLDNFNQNYKNDSKDISVGRLAKVVLAATTLNQDVKNFNGVNLDEKLKSQCESSKGFTNYKMWTIIALKASGFKFDEKKAFDYLKGQQQKDGGFSWMENSNQSDAWPDMTAMAVYSMNMLGKDKNNVEVQNALDFLKKSLKNLDLNPKMQSSESLSQIIMAVTSANDNIKAYKANNNSLINELLNYETNDGCFKHAKPEKKFNDMATNQALQALLFYKYNSNLFKKLK